MGLYLKPKESKTDLQASKELCLDFVLDNLVILILSGEIEKMQKLKNHCLLDNIL